MRDLSIPILLVGIGMLVIVALLAVLGRQLSISRSRGAFACSLHRKGLVSAPGWQHGMMRFGRDRLRWFRAFSLRWRPEVVIRRAEIAEVVRSRLPAGQSGAEEVADMCLVEFQLVDGRRIRALMDLVSGAALNSWVEAAPTGLVRGDAD